MRPATSGLVGDADGAAVDQAPGLVWVGRQMQVGVEDLAGPQLLVLDRLRLLDLDDHVGAGVDLRCRGRDARAGGDIVLVGEADGGAGLGFDRHLVAVAAQFARTGRRQADAVFVVLDFLRYADVHDRSCRGLLRIMAVISPGKLHQESA